MSTTSKASERITALLDDNSFVEIGAQITARATDFNLKQTETPSDGVVTGYGVINGNLVYVYSQDASVLGGSIGEMHAKKIANLYDLAMKTGAPVIGLIDSAGLRLQEATDALDAFIAHQKEVVRRRTEFDLRHAKARYHIVEGLIKAISILDEVLKTIRASKNKQESIDNLVERFEFTVEQATSDVNNMLQTGKV